MLKFKVYNQCGLVVLKIGGNDRSLAEFGTSGGFLLTAEEARSIARAMTDAANSIDHAGKFGLLRDPVPEPPFVFREE